jgi:hypothetical protein
MLKRIPKFVQTSVCFVFWIALLLGPEILIMGCSYRETVDKTTRTVEKTTKKLTRGIKFGGDNLKRKTVVIGFKNKSLHQSQDFTQLFLKGLPEYLGNECKVAIVTNSGQDERLKNFKELPRLESGLTDNNALVIIGRDLGLNAIVSGSLDYITMIDELRGVILKDTHHVIQILVSVEVYDTETGTKVLDESFSREVEVEGLDYELMRAEEKLSLPDLNETLAELIGDMGESICWAISDQPWNGFITSVAGDKITLSAGSQIGLKPGDVLEVYDNSRVLEGVGGQRFFIHGAKIGEIKITAVEPDTSEAVVVSDDGIKTGNSVRPK